MRDREGRTLANAHLLGFLWRILKLLFYGIRPVFVFDGGAPVQKRRTLANRKQQRTNATETHARAAEKLLAAQLRQAALAHVHGPAPAQDEGLADGTVYYDSVGRTNRPQVSGRMNDTPAAAPQKKRQYHKDPYQLPALEEALPTGPAKKQDLRLATESELRALMNQLAPDDLDTNSELFRSLPPELQYELVGDLRAQSRGTSYQRLQDMLAAAPTPIDFSKAQIAGLRTRNDLTQKVLTVTDEIGSANIQVPLRVAGQRNREYVLVHIDDGDGGYALGTRDAGTTQETAIDVEKEEKRRMPLAHIDDDEDLEALGMEDVEIPSEAPAPDPELDALVHLESDPKVRKERALELLGARAEHHRRQKRTESGAEAREERMYGHVEKHAPSTLFRDGRSAAMQRKDATRTRSIVEELSDDDAEDDTFVPDADEDDMEDVEVDAFREERPAAHMDAPDERVDVQSADDEDVNVSLASARESKTAPANEHAIPNLEIIPSAQLEEECKPQEASDVKEEEDDVFVISSPAKPVKDVLDKDQSERKEREQKSEASEPQMATQAEPVRARLQKDAPYTQAAAKASLEVPEPATETAVPIMTHFAESTTKAATSAPSAPPKSKPVKAPLATSDADCTAPSGAPEPTSEVPSALYAPQAPPEPVTREPSAPTPQKHVSSTPIPSAPPHTPSQRPELSADTRPSEPAPVQSPPDSIPSQSFPDATPELTYPTRDESNAGAAAPEPSPAPIATISPRPTEAHSPRDPTPFEWSPSPSPEPQMLGPDGFPLPSAEEVAELEEAEEAELTHLDTDQTEFASFLSTTSGRNFRDLQREVGAEVEALRQDRARLRRSEEDVTLQMAAEVQAMLRLFGLPYVTAPMEAEAQCAQLATQNLVDGIITDDSDVFLFGGTPVYRNMFNNKRMVECYLLSDIQRELSLDRGRLIQLAFLLGSDYTEGLAGVGPVMAMEILSLYPGQDGLEKFRGWWQQVQIGAENDPNDSRIKVRRRIKRALRDRVHLSNDWPDQGAKQAYVEPSVDASDEPFVWGNADLDALRAFLGEYLHWPSTKTDQYLLPVIEQQRKNDRLRRVQATLDQSGFISGRLVGEMRSSGAPRGPAYGSTRLQKVVNDFRSAARQRTPEVDEAPKRAPKKRAPRRASDEEEEYVPRPTQRRRKGESAAQAGRSSSLMTE